MDNYYSYDDLYDIVNERITHGECDEIEFKDSRGGFPKSFWETYSAFANTQGGVIVLGIKEQAGDYILSGLSKREAEKHVETFWKLIRNPQTISVCLVSNGDVDIIELKGGCIVLIRIPQADYKTRPVYHKLSAERGTYRRGGDGDFLCTPTEVRRMIADACHTVSADSRILKGFTWEDIDQPSLEQYRRLFAISKPDHPWLGEDNEGLMRKLGGYRKDRETAEEGFTLAGLLMFGKVEAIRDPNCAPQFFPDYKEIPSGMSSMRWLTRICPDGTWECNLFQFYIRVLPKLQATLPTPFRIEANQRIDDTPAKEALREAMANLCVHADHSEEGSLLVTLYPDRIVFSNPGTMLISREQFYRGGQSVCRNPSLQTMFMQIGAVEKAGSGVDKILKGWSSQGWAPPYPEEIFRPNRVELIMPLQDLIAPQVSQKLIDKLGTEYMKDIDEHERMILSVTSLEEVTNHARLCELLPIHKADITLKLRKLCIEGALISTGRGRGTTYRLKANDEIGKADGEIGKADSEIGKADSEIGKADSEIGKADSGIGKARKSKMSLEEAEILIFAYCQDEWRSAQEIAGHLERNPKYVVNHIIPKLDSRLERLYTYSKHPNQKYRTRPQEKDGK